MNYENMMPHLITFGTLMVGFIIFVRVALAELKSRDDRISDKIDSNHKSVSDKMDTLKSEVQSIKTEVHDVKQELKSQNERLHLTITEIEKVKVVLPSRKNPAN